MGATESLPPHDELLDEEDLPRMTLLEHLEELRNRIFRTLIALVVGFGVCWTFHRDIYRFLSAPVKPHVDKMIFLTLTEPFVLYMKVSALAALFLVSPYVLYQVWAFVAPGLYRREKLYAIPFIFFGSLFFIGGGVFGYYVAFPFAAEFLLTLGEDFEAQLTVSAYFSTMMTIILMLGVTFELPILIFMLAQLGVVTPGFLLRNFRWAVLIIFVLAAIITPTPDIFNLCVFAIPAIGLYLLGVAAAAVVQWRKSGD